VLHWESVRAQILIPGVRLEVYLFARVLILVPGYGAGVLDSQGDHCRYVDRSVLGTHTWFLASPEGFGPKGIRSTMPAIATTLLGTLAGSWQKAVRDAARTAAGFAAACTFLILSGALADISFRVNKNLWTSSYVLLPAG
jgi:predicted acyltransferase